MRRTLAALALAVVLPLPLFAAEVTIQPGETLSDLADRHGVSLSRLMKANGITDADRVEAGQRLTIPGGGGRQAKVTGGKVTVKPGETLSEIADHHGMSLSKLLQLNGISNPDHVEVGQSLVVSSAVKTGSAAKGSSPTFSYAPGARDHVVRPGESLSAIAKGYGVPMSRLVALNRIENPNKVEAGDRLRLEGTPPTNATTSAPKSSPRTSSPRPTPVTPAAKAPTTPAKLAKATSPAPAPAAAPAAAAGTATTATASWRTYGPLQVDWSNWQPMGGSLVAASLNGSGQPFYLAINCSAHKLNATTADGQWKTWDDPTTDFEKKLVTDLCKSRPG